MSWLRIAVVKGRNLPSPVIAWKLAADLQTHRERWQERVPPVSEPHTGNILLAQIPFPILDTCFNGCIFSACFWLRAQNLLAACRGFWCCSQNPARKLQLTDPPVPAGKSSNCGSENTAKAANWSIWAAPHLSPMISLTQLSLVLVPAHKETSTEMSPGTYATLLQKHKTVKCESFTPAATN